jgi:hypothetical protein
VAPLARASAFTWLLIAAYLALTAARGIRDPFAR